MGIGGGNVKAGVCVAKSEREALQNFKAGDILVIDSTTNELLDVMKKASGIITAQPGVNSHAAIVGLALNIPGYCGSKGLHPDSAQRNFDSAGCQQGHCLQPDKPAGLASMGERRWRPLERSPGMRRILKQAMLILAAAVLMMAAAGCGQQEEPAEQAVQTPPVQQEQAPDDVQEEEEQPEVATPSLDRPDPAGTAEKRGHRRLAADRRYRNRRGGGAGKGQRGVQAPERVGRIQLDRQLLCRL